MAVRLLTIREVCSALRVSRGTVHNLVRRGELVPSYVGSLPRFEAEEVRDYVRRHRHSGGRDGLPEREAEILNGLREMLDAREVK
jgi:excisionase family DNA binding protein